MVTSLCQKFDIWETLSVNFECVWAPSIKDVNAQSTCSVWPFVRFIFLWPKISLEQTWNRAGLAWLPSWSSPTFPLGVVQLVRLDVQKTLRSEGGQPQDVAVCRNLCWDKRVEWIDGCCTASYLKQKPEFNHLLEKYWLNLSTMTHLQEADAVVSL